MTITTEMAQRIERQRKAAEWALDAWKKFCDAPDDIDLERLLSMEELTLISNHNAASNPTNVLALLDALAAKDKQIAEQREYYEGVIADGSKRIAELEEIATDYGMKFQRAQDALKHAALMHRDEARPEQQPVAYMVIRDAGDLLYPAKCKKQAEWEAANMNGKLIALSPSAPAAQPVAYQYRTFDPEYDEWGEWEDCSESAFEQYQLEEAAFAGVNTRKIYTAAPAAQPVTVKLPNRLQPGSDGPDDWYLHSDPDGEYMNADDVIAVLTAAGITIAEGE